MMMLFMDDVDAAAADDDVDVDDVDDADNVDDDDEVMSVCCGPWLSPISQYTFVSTYTQ